ncbi:MAG: hypothetical protein ABI338_02685, partial [Gemmatimonadaceae bacterium]
NALVSCGMSIRSLPMIALARALTCALASVALASVAVASVARAQCRPPRDSHEARLLAFYSVPIAFSADQSSLALSPGAMRLSLEGAFVPTAPATLQQTGYCYAGKAENTGLTRFFGRPRLAIGLPGGLGLEVSYLPPVTVASATPNIASAALWITHAMSSQLLLTLRAHGTVGVVKGPITCPRAALQQSDPAAPCYGTSPSTDEFSPNMLGGELIASSNPAAAGRVRFSGGLGLNELYPRFKVGFSDLLGGTDRTRISVNLTRITALAGVTLTLTHRCDASAQAFSSLSDATTVRGTIGCTLNR